MRDAGRQQALVGRLQQLGTATTVTSLAAAAAAPVQHRVPGQVAGPQAPHHACAAGPSPRCARAAAWPCRGWRRQRPWGSACAAAPIHEQEAVAGWKKCTTFSLGSMQQQQDSRMRSTSTAGTPLPSRPPPAHLVICERRARAGAAHVAIAAPLLAPLCRLALLSLAPRLLLAVRLAALRHG